MATDVAMRCPMCAGASGNYEATIALSQDDTAAGQEVLAVVKHLLEEHRDGKPLRLTINGRVVLDEWEPEP